ncbi:MAG TPA: hypothetical protein VGR44_01235 [Methylomirabilota bacterium]|jgi:hypothetical protein|nr:hypothetical protein [Methylomirabilota bacterium]
MVTIRGWLAMLFLLAPLLMLGAPGLAGAQEEQKLRFVFTPQVWFTNIPQNGFAAAAAGGSVQAPFGFPFASFDVSDLDRQGPDPTSGLFPQWGGQFAVQYGRWTAGLAAQYASFEHRTHLLSGENTKLNAVSGGFPTQFDLQAPCSNPALNIAPCGTKLQTEIIRTDRVDIDLTLSYFFPDVFKDLMDLSLGGGFKWVRASGHRQLVDNFTFIAGDYCLKEHDFPARDTPANQVCGRVNKASFLDNTYAATFPTTFNFHLTQSGKWLLPFTATPLIGWQERVDEVFGYSTSTAYGGTLDLGVRYVLDNGVAIYVGYRGQAIIGINRYVAHGPLINMSVPLGGK